MYTCLALSARHFYTLSIAITVDYADLNRSKALHKLNALRHKVLIILYLLEIRDNTCAYGRVYVYVSSFSTIKVKPTAITASITKESQKGRYSPRHHHVEFSIEIRLEGAFGILKRLSETRTIKQTVRSETLTELRIGQNAPVFKEIITHI